MIPAIRQHIAAGRKDAAIDLLFDTLDDLMLAGRFDETIAHLRAIHVGAMPPFILLGALTITLPWRDQLGDARADVVTLARNVITEQQGQECANDCLRGLE